MKSALFQNSTVHLDTLGRDRYQHYYLSGRNGQLSCPSCLEPVRLYLGIEKEPHFYHIYHPAKECPEAPAVQEASHTGETESHGFRLPKGRAIGTVTATLGFQAAQALAISTRSKVETIPTLENPHDYIKLLEAEGFTLDGNQAAAVTQTEGPILVLAGAGSGKTRVLTARTAYMMDVGGIDPSEIMLVTFTTKAAQEMKSRLLRYPNMRSERLSKLVSGTFHSIFYRILMHADGGKWRQDKLLKKEWQREKIVKDSGRELGFSEKDYAYDLALQQIGFWKNSLLLPKDVKAESDWEETALLLYERYEQFKQIQGLFDFDDMLTGCHELFQSRPEILQMYQERFHYFLIDEFQDINKVQYELIKMLSARSKNVCAVGDDDQTIYSFRGSSPEFLLNFESDFPGTRLILLNQNYRSSHEIVAAANRIISYNKKRRRKEMAANMSIGLPPVVFFPHDEEEEATMIVTDIQEKIASGADPSEFAILYRTHAGSRAVFERLASSNLPFRIEQDAESFYERRTVKTVLGFLKLAVDEDDIGAVAAILPALFLKQEVLNDIKAASILDDCSALEALGKVKTAHAFQMKKLKTAVTAIKGMKGISPFTAIERIEKDLGFLDYLKKRGSEGNKLEKGSDDVKDLKVAAKSFGNIHALLEHADHMTAMNKEIKSLSKHFASSITLSTIHRAKGLEYKNVYIIGAVDGSLPHDYALESLRNGDSAPLEEERRLFYVAITRAMERLYISVPSMRRNRSAHPTRFLTPVRNDLKN
ncbi:ATP-dependent DNA helicase Rep [Bacillus sp. FJAT-18017]|uniref:UvrD-helicase domain-containing protein n=1 Tax=Bacillus sp. FJAT-18017 TaxID=1705566 RepID=UPI0006AF0438|nr:ATP-dependent helicase [Bacillus sp. FJAT-18017]ALC91825.1 ATP-dependent DNA helicase Rep [Bacillus sp. FJAT-18017]